MRTIRDGEPRTSTSTFTQLLSLEDSLSLSLTHTQTQCALCDQSIEAQALNDIVI